jgi:hypothetical protein
MIGADQGTWLRGIPLYGRIRYRDIYSGIDLEYRGQGGTLTYRFVVHPGADVQLIHVAFTETQPGTQNTLALGSAAGPVLEETPLVYQQTAGGRWAPAGHAALQVDRPRTGGQLSLAPAAYDRQRALAIDSVLDFGSYLGGHGDDSVNAVTADASGGSFMAGYTDASDFPVTPGVFQHRYPGTTTSDSIGGVDGSSVAFVAHLNAAGTVLLYATYLGSRDSDTSATGVAVDRTGTATIAGWTAGNTFPTTAGALLRHKPAGDPDQASAFAARLSATGTALLSATYIGVVNAFSTLGMAAIPAVFVGTDAENDIVVASTTGSSHISTSGHTPQPRFPSRMVDVEDTSGLRDWDHRHRQSRSVRLS